MKHWIIAALLLAMLPQSWATSFVGADATAGQVLHAKHCVSCHAQQYGGPEGENIYLRRTRTVKSAEGLAQRITLCTSMLKLGLFPEDELNIAGYLNQRYYHFP
ncbi:MAG: hypothetical protein JNM61_09030 [Zoogloeaceae bacterium]|nr:hypothetical protein [Zoogloeaceae bacterium]